MSHDDKYEKALKAIKELFSDASVSQQDTIVSLEALIEEISIMVDAIKTDIETT